VSLVRRLQRRGLYPQKQIHPFGYIGITWDLCWLAFFDVDDGILAANSDFKADAIVNIIASMFKIRKLGVPTDFLGIHIQRNCERGTISIHQEDKAMALAIDLGVSGQRKATPMTPETFAGLWMAKTGEPMAGKEQYQATIGSLLHLAQSTRPDIALPVGALAAYSAASAPHREAILDEVRYVVCTAGRRISFGGWAAPVEVWCDANGAACHDTRHSTTGWAVVMYGEQFPGPARSNRQRQPPRWRLSTRHVGLWRGKGSCLSTRSRTWAHCRLIFLCQGRWLLHVTTKQPYPCARTPRRASAVSTLTLCITLPGIVS
jgi:hypothetical protein